MNQAIETLVTEGEILEGEAKRRPDRSPALNKNLNNAQQEYHTSYTRLESLRNLAERYDGYGNSIRRVMECRDCVRGIHGSSGSTFLDVPKEYEMAIETALGGSIQMWSLTLRNTAKIMIGHLKKNRYGRATFLPLTAVSSRGGFPEPQALRSRSHRCSCRSGKNKGGTERDWVRISWGGSWWWTIWTMPFPWPDNNVFHPHGNARRRSFKSRRLHERRRL